jgi:maltose alpha-D-glucosyltransferase/alpha-amylase
VLNGGRPDIFALRYTWRNNAVLFVHNLGAEPWEVNLPSQPGSLLVNLLSDDHSTPAANGAHRLLMEPYGYRWFRVGGLDYLLRRTEA